ncbi:maleylpyruvate isomerase family mycothiol-dependent enzyme [Streptomyces sp. AV19]|uniref:sterol carrier family protein n=1 Tax=Streptomyces sp. AV19 TaxID=2793068 RepID=UPI0018FE2F27|nr:sterol carrier family protein [Streptomyces sp. AV19]MBH1934567.1 maleylpyruvate isomerase family mycothiol-dependent enzyme [Streptomyces sp. AV19]MDG4530885.1 sterol carrier family protein [Streptomyces sp. AV19]
MSPAPRTPRPRAYDPAKVRTALEAELRVLRERVNALCEGGNADEALAAPTRLGDWTVRELIVHIAAVLERLPRYLAEPAPDPAAPRVDLRSYVPLLRTAAASVDEEAREATAAGAEPRAVADRLNTAVDRLTEAAAADPATVITSRFGPMTVADFLVTRLLEAVVHADDLAAATGVPITHDRQALAAVTRLLADALAARAPGGSVEVRVPPFAVIQCVEGPRHTRGTPPNVVETDPLTWIRLATGRLAWAAAVEEALVSASGERADLSAQLPLLS